MWRNYLASALGNFSRNRLYAAINIAGLALGVAAALLIALFVREELSWDRFFPGWRDVYLLTETKDQIDHRLLAERWDSSFPDLAAQLEVQFPQVEAVARVMTVEEPPHLRHGGVSADETGFVWMDPSFFLIMPLKAVAGDPRTALATPDGVVLTRSAARKYFGRDDPVGERLDVDPALGPAAAKVSPAFAGLHPMRVTAVIEDLPSNSDLKGEVFASSLAPFSSFALYDQTQDQGPFRADAYTFVRLKPGASAGEMRAELAAFAARRFPVYPPGFRVGLHLTPIGELHLSPSDQPMAPHGDPKVLAALAAIGVLIVLSASINFVTLMTARAGRRATETGVRKAVGAHRSDLMIQFLGEAMLYAAAAMVLAIGLTEAILPQMNAALKRTIAFDYLGDPRLAAALVAATVVLGLLAGAYPALVLSAWRPAAVLKGRVVQSPAGGVVRQALVTLQFAILIGLGVTAATLWRQTLFSLESQLRVDGSRVLMVVGACAPGSSSRTFRARVAAVPGVAAAVCASEDAIFESGMILSAHTQGRPGVPVVAAPVDFGALEFYGLEPLAGRFFVRGRGDDGRLADKDAPGNPPVVVNEAAMHELGFRSPAEAVGQIVTWNRRRWSAAPNWGVTGASEIIGVAPDYPLYTRHPVWPQFFYVDPYALDVLGVRLTGARIPEALAGVDAAWADTAHTMIHRRFLDQEMQEMYAGVILQGTAISLGAGLALVIAGLGLFGLAAHSAEQRTKEIGVRKAMGASTTDVVRLLLWQFSRPVLWANLIAWPLAWWAMSRWLSGFAYHVDLPFWLFLAAGAAALLIACATVLTHALAVARAAPATALRYE